MSEKHRSKIIRLDTNQILIANMSNSLQEQDLTKPVNCNGLGRIHHFRRKSTSPWPENPLPLDPACKALGLPKTDLLEAQVFQCAACNFDCWYCFVPTNLMRADIKHSEWCDSKLLIDLYLEQNELPKIIDLSGGQPELVPEWVLWMMNEIRKRDLSSCIYLWSDDNLSTDFFWRFLTDSQRGTIENYSSYGRVGCFKGFDEQSFGFNTNMEQSLFQQQFKLMKKLLRTKIDIYAYVIFTTPTIDNIDRKIHEFIERLQELNENLPLRTVPLEIKPFVPMIQRLDHIRKKALEYQYIVVRRWQEELERRFPQEMRDKTISDIKLN